MSDTITAAASSAPAQPTSAPVGATPLDLATPTGGSPASGATAASAAPAAAPQPRQQADDSKEPHWLADRLRRAEEGARRALLKDFGFDDPKDVKKAIDEHKARLESEKSELQKAQERAKNLEGAAAERDLYRAKVEGWAKAEFEALNEQQKAAIERLAGEDPLRRAEAIELLRPTWTALGTTSAANATPTTSPAAAATNTPGTPPPIPAPASTAPPIAAPKPSGTQTAWEKFRQIEQDQGHAAASLFYQFNQKDIETSRPIA